MSEKRKITSNGVLIVGVGLTAAVGQLSLVRLTAQSFSGNEITICIAIGHWLLWTGIGSLLGSRLIRRRQSANFLSILLLVYPIMLLVAGYLFLLIRRLFAIELSEIIGLGRIFLLTGLLTIIPALINGLFFPLLVNWIDRQKLRFPVHRVYIFEMLGSALGGLVFLGFVLVGFNTLIILQLTAGLLLLIGNYLFLKSLLWKILITGLVVVAEWGFSACLVPALVKLKWQPYRIQAYRESPHQLISRLSHDGGVSIFTNNEPVWTFDIEENAEEAVHFGMLNHLAPHHVLIIGIAGNDLYNQLLKYPSLESITVVQNDRILADMLQEDNVLDYRFPVDVRIVVDDPIQFLKQAPQCYDVVYLNIPLPVNAMWNVYYSQEFFTLLYEQLSNLAVVELQLPGSETYFTPEHLAFLKVMENTARSVFAETAWIPGETLHLLVSNSALSNRIEHYRFELQFRGIENLYIRENYLTDRLSDWRVEFLETQLSSCSEKQINTIQQPMAFYYSTILWDRHTGGILKDIYKALRKVPVSYLLGITAVVLFLILLILHKKRKHTSILQLNMALVGFSIMSLESIIIISMQSYVGALYIRITLLTTAFMLGAAAGAYWEKDSQPDSNRFTATIAIGVLLLAVLSCAIILVFRWNILANPVTYYAILMIVGLAGGVIFPTFSRLLNRELSTGVAPSSGSIYAWDIVGSCLGIYLTSGLIIPIFGLLTGIIFIIFILAIVSGSVILLYNGK